MYRDTEDDLLLSDRIVSRNRSVAALIPLMAVVLIAFLTIGLGLPVLPLHVHDDLGFNAFVVGLVTGSQFGAALLSRVWAGHYADRAGAKRAVIIGLITAAVAGLLYFASLDVAGMPRVSVTILLLGRGLLGAAESFIITGAVSWGLFLAGPASAGRVIAWIGMALFAALALGAPLGTALYAIDGFAAVAAATAVIPLLTLLLVIPLSDAQTQRAARPALLTVVRAVWTPGLASALSSIGFGAIITFSSLLSVSHGWSPVWLVFTCFATSLVVTRSLFGHIPDHLGGAKVALVCILIQAAGLALIWLAPGRGVAAAGAILAGLGYSLVYPGLGVEAVRRAPQESRGLAMGAYTVFLDVALGFGSPALGMIAGVAGLRTVFLASAILALCAAPIALRLVHTTSPERKCQCHMQL